MNEQEFLEKYGFAKVYFHSVDKYRVIYRNNELGIVCSGILEYRSYMLHEETVQDIFDLDVFQFQVLPTKSLPPDPSISPNWTH